MIKGDSKQAQTAISWKAIDEAGNLPADMTAEQARVTILILAEL